MSDNLHVWDIAHTIEDGDGVCGDCPFCDENLEDACIVTERFKCAWCGHCTRNHVHRAAPLAGSNSG